MSVAIIFDTEYTTWEGAMQRQWSGPGECREIVQIGAVKINPADFAIIDTLELLVRPVRNPVLSDYFIRLTGITQQQVDTRAVTFAQGLARFMEFTEGQAPWSYGADVDVIAENMRLLGMAIPTGWWCAEQTNLAPWFHQHAPQTRGVNSGRLAATLGVAEINHEHTGLGDSLSILAAMKHLVFDQGKPRLF